VVDSASIEVNRRARRNKTDRTDARKLVLLLVRICLGDHRAWREVRVPTMAQEAARAVSRERRTLLVEQTRLVNQLRGWLATWGARLRGHQTAGWWRHVRNWSGAPLPAPVQAQLARASARLGWLADQIAALDAQQQVAMRWQRASRLTQWYLERFGRGKRARRIGIVALARKLVIALWRYATTNVGPEGAVLKA
jgi:transposase